ncbi:STAS domain-containing protein [Spirillospora sp. CA-253888]
MNELSLSVTETDGRLVIAVSGDLDITYSDHLVALTAARVPGDARTIVDLTGLTFLDSAGLGALLQLWKRLQRGGGDMILVGATFRNARPLWFTGLADRLPRTDTVEEALER